jgi:hypothetical protein
MASHSGSNCRRRAAVSAAPDRPGGNGQVKFQECIVAGQRRMYRCRATYRRLTPMAEAIRTCPGAGGYPPEGRRGERNTAMSSGSMATELRPAGSARQVYAPPRSRTMRCGWRCWGAAYPAPGKAANAGEPLLRPAHEEWVSFGRHEPHSARRRPHSGAPSAGQKQQPNRGSQAVRPRRFRPKAGRVLPR